MLTDGLYQYNNATIEWRKHPDSTTANSFKKNSWESKSRAAQEYLKYCNDLFDFVKKADIDEKDLKIKIISEYLELYKTKISYGEARNIEDFLKVFKYINYYSSYKSFIKEIWIMLFK